MNKVILMGRLGKDPEYRKFDSGSELVSFSLATSESRKDKDGQKVEETEWHNITFWGKSADVLNQYVKKGDQLLVEGSIRTREYEVDGQKRYATDIIGRNFHFIGGMSNGGNQDSDAQKTSPPPPKTSFNDSIKRETSVSEPADDLPF